MSGDRNGQSAVYNLLNVYIILLTKLTRGKSRHSRPVNVVRDVLDPPGTNYRLSGIALLSESSYSGLKDQMVTTMRSVLNRLREHSIELRRQLDNFTSESKAILAVTSNFTVKSGLRVLSLEQGWRILFADCLE